jgi:hypothetical protein
MTDWTCECIDYRPGAYGMCLRCMRVPADVMAARAGRLEGRLVRSTTRDLVKRRSAG